MLSGIIAIGVYSFPVTYKCHIKTLNHLFNKSKANVVFANLFFPHGARLGYNVLLIRCRPQGEILLAAALTHEAASCWDCRWRFHTVSPMLVKYQSVYVHKSSAHKHLFWFSVASFRGLSACISCTGLKILHVNLRIEKPQYLWGIYLYIKSGTTNIFVGDDPPDGDWAELSDYSCWFDFNIYLVPTAIKFKLGRDWIKFWMLPSDKLFLCTQLLLV